MSYKSSHLGSVIDTSIQKIVDVLFLLKTGGTLTGSLIVTPSSDAANAVKITDKDGNLILSIDTINNHIMIGHPDNTPPITTNATLMLQAGAGGSVGASILLARYFNTTSNLRGSAILHYYNAGEQLVFCIGSNSDVSNYTYAKMILHESGSLFLGYTANPAAYKLAVNGTAYFSGLITGIGISIIGTSTFDGLLTLKNGTNGVPAGLFMEQNLPILEFGINDSRFGTRDQDLQGGFFRLESRIGQDLFSIFSRAAEAANDPWPAFSVSTAGRARLYNPGGSDYADLIVNGSGDLTITPSGSNIVCAVFPVTPSAAPTSNYQVANKKYVDYSSTAARPYQVCTLRFYTLLDGSAQGDPGDLATLTFDVFENTIGTLEMEEPTPTNQIVFRFKNEAEEYISGLWWVNFPSVDLSHNELYDAGYSLPDTDEIRLTHPYDYIHNQIYYIEIRLYPSKDTFTADAFRVGD